MENYRINPRNKVNKTFRTILEEAKKRNFLKEKSQDALTWYKNRVLEVSDNVTYRSVLNLQERYRKTIMLGQMYFFKYDPKYKEELPYYDMFPCILVVKFTRSGFTGINFHYLPYVLRAKLLDGLMNIRNNNKFDRTTKMLTTYKYLNSISSLRYFKPCYKKYLINKVRSPMIKIESIEWGMATFLPVEEFRKKSKQFVWRESVRKIL